MIDLKVSTCMRSMREEREGKERRTGRPTVVHAVLLVVLKRSSRWQESMGII